MVYPAPGVSGEASQEMAIPPAGLESACGGQAHYLRKGNREVVQGPGGKLVATLASGLAESALLVELAIGHKPLIS